MREETLEENDVMEILSNCRFMVGSSVGTLNLNALCSSTNSSIFEAMKLLMLEKAFGLMVNFCAFSIATDTDGVSTMDDLKEC